MTQKLGFEARIQYFGWVTTFCKHAIVLWCPMKQLWQMYSQFSECDCFRKWAKATEKNCNMNSFAAVKCFSALMYKYNYLDIDRKWNATSETSAINSKSPWNSSKFNLLCKAVPPNASEWSSWRSFYCFKHMYRDQTIIRLLLE